MEKSVSTLATLPPELVVHVCRLLSPPDLCRFGSVSRLLHAVVAGEDSLWRRHYLQRFPPLTPVRTQAVRRRSVVPLANEEDGEADDDGAITGSGATATTSWRIKFGKSWMEEKEWRHGDCVQTIVRNENPEDDSMTWCVSLGQQMAASGSQDGMVRLWDVKRRRWRNTIHAGSFFISEVKLFQDDTRLLTGGGDRIIAIWNTKARNPQQISRYLAGDAVWSLDMDERSARIAAGTVRRTLEVWDMYTGKRIHLFPNAHDDVITCTRLLDDYLVSCSEDSFILLWDLRTDKYVRKIRSHPVLCCQVDENKIVSGGKNGYVSFWDWQGLPLQHKRVGGMIRDLKYDDTKMVIATGDSQGIQIYDANMRTKWRDLRGEYARTWSIDFNDKGYLVGIDVQLAVWRFRSR